MQRGDSRALIVTTYKDPTTKEELCEVRVGRYTVLRMTMDEAEAAANAIQRVRQLVFDKLRRKTANALVTKSYVGSSNREEYR